MKFITAVGDGFGASYITVCPDGSAMVSVGASVEREEELAREESIEIVVRIRSVDAKTIGEIQRASMERAAVLSRVAAQVLSSPT